MERHPWWTRAVLLVAVTAVGVTGLVAGVALDDLPLLFGIATAAFAVVLDIEIVSRGEDKTTPIDDPRGRDGELMIPWAEHQQVVRELTAQAGPGFGGEGQVLDDAALDALPDEDDDG